MFIGKKKINITEKLLFHIILIVTCTIILNSCNKSNNYISNKDNDRISILKDSFDQIIKKNTLLDESSIIELESSDLRILRNLIYAKYGYNFESNDLYYYFYMAGSKPFGYSFKIDNNFTASKLTEIDKKNIEIIVSIERGNNFQQNQELYINDELDYNTKNVYLCLVEDVFSFFNEELYFIDTELKKKNYKETDDYDKYYQEIRYLKTQYISKTHKILINNSLSDYSLQDQGMFYQLLDLPEFAYYIYPYESQSDIPTEYSQIEGYFSNVKLHSRQIYSKELHFNLSIFSFFLPMSEEIGSIIENNMSDIDIIFEFNIKEDGKYIYFDESSTIMSEGGIFEWFKRPMIEVENSKLIIISNKSQHVIYEKNLDERNH